MSVATVAMAAATGKVATAFATVATALAIFAMAIATGYQVFGATAATGNRMWPDTEHSVLDIWAI